MTSRCAARRLSLCFGPLLAFVCPLAEAKTCVWKITAPSGGVLYLGGSQHRLKSTDYPLPPSYNRAFDLSQRLAFEESPEDAAAAMKRLEKSGLYPKGDELRSHVDPRTYEYAAKVFARFGMPADKLARCRPWFLVYLLSASGGGPGVESYFAGRARTYGRPIEGLESNSDHLGVFSGLTDRQSEALLLVTFIQAKGDAKADLAKMTAAWRGGDPDYLERLLRDEYRDFPAMSDRLLAVRNRAWIPRIEGWIRSGRIYFVLAGAAHMGGASGLLALLRERGYQIEQW
jgi:uncharacterized protein